MLERWQVSACAGFHQLMISRRGACSLICHFILLNQDCSEQDDDLRELQENLFSLCFLVANQLSAV